MVLPAALEPIVAAPPAKLMPIKPAAETELPAALDTLMAWMVFELMVEEVVPTLA